jgi:hypothetical protein
MAAATWSATAFAPQEALGSRYSSAKCKGRSGDLSITSKPSEGASSTSKLEYESAVRLVTQMRAPARSRPAGEITGQIATILIRTVTSIVLKREPWWPYGFNGLLAAFARDGMAAPAATSLRRTAAPRTTLIPASSPDFFIEDTPTAVLVRQVLGAIDPFEVSTVAKLKAARQRKERTGKCEGRKSHAEINPEMVQIAKELVPAEARQFPAANAAGLAARGYVNLTAKRFSGVSGASMLGA